MGAKTCIARFDWACHGHRRAGTYVFFLCTTGRWNLDETRRLACTPTSSRQNGLSLPRRWPLCGRGRPRHTSHSDRLLKCQHHFMVQVRSVFLSRALKRDRHILTADTNRKAIKKAKRPQPRRNLAWPVHAGRTRAQREFTLEGRRRGRMDFESRRH